MVEPDGLPFCINGVLSITAAATEPEGFPVKEPEGFQKPAQPPPTTASLPTPPAQPVDLRELAAAQQGCPDCARGATSPALRVIAVKMEDNTLLVDASSGVLRPLVPEPFRRAIFTAVHNIAHPGVRASRRLISSRFVWPKMGADIKNWCNECQACQRAKASNLPAAAVQPIPVPIIRFSHVHIDLVGPLPRSNEGFAYLFTAVDRSTRWAEAWPLRATTAADCAEAFVSGWVSRFGVPASLTSDRGVQFSSAVWAALMKQLGVKHNMTTAFHPQSNGMVERLHRRLKEALKAREATTDWPRHLPWVLLGLRSSPREDSGVSAAELVYGAALSLPGQFIAGREPPPAAVTQPLQSGTSCASPHLARRDNGAPPPPPPSSLMAAKFVYIRAPPAAPSLAPAYRGPYEVVKKADKFFIVKLGGRFDAISIDRLKPHLGGTATATPPPRRGRPPGRAS
jgi:transposase InsO family protein